MIMHSTREVLGAADLVYIYNLMSGFFLDKLLKRFHLLLSHDYSIFILSLSYKRYIRFGQVTTLHGWHRALWISHNIVPPTGALDRFSRALGHGRI